MAPAQPPKTAVSLEGTWFVVAWEAEGKQAPTEAVKGKKMVIRRNEIAGVPPGLTGRLGFKLHLEATPKEIDLFSLEGKHEGTKDPGIFTLDGTRLRLCYGGKIRPRKFQTTPGSGLVMVTLERESPARPVQADKGPAYRKGQDEAGNDLARGKLRYRWYGQPTGTDKLLAEILLEDHGIHLDIVAGCAVSTEVRQRADGYNDVILAHMTKKGQKTFLAAAEKKARLQWDRMSPNERTRRFGFTPLLDRPVSLDASGRLPLRAALKKLAGDVGLGLEFDHDALKKTALDLDRTVTVKFENVPLARALGYLIDWNTHPDLLREVRGDKLVFTTLEAWQARIVSKLPDWLKPLYNKGLLATLDDGDEVATVTTGTIATDELLARLRTLPKLRELHLEATREVTPAGLAHLGKMPRLEKLSLYQITAGDNGLGDEAIRSVAGLVSLRELWIGECGTTDAGVKLLDKLPKLTTLTLRQEVHLTDAALGSIARLPQLKSLSLPSYVGLRRGWVRFSAEGARQARELVEDSTPREGWMRFSAKGIRQLEKLKHLEVLHLVGHDVPADALEFPHLKSLGLGYSSPDDPALANRGAGRGGIGDDVARKIGDLRNLQELELSYSAIGDDGFKSIAGLPGLRRLNVRSTHITDMGIAHLRNHKGLEHISLRIAGLGDRTLQHLAHIETLTRLDLDGSGVPGGPPSRNVSIAGLQQLKNLPGLDTLWLSHFDIPVGGYVGLKELRHLRELTLLRTNITGAEREALIKALPRTRISAPTGGGNYLRVPKRNR
ncbi:MAG: TIGR03067 domain-containing protein [Gemmataceae bacterium]